MAAANGSHFQSRGLFYGSVEQSMHRGVQNVGVQKNNNLRLGTALSNQIFKMRME